MPQSIIDFILKEELLKRFAFLLLNELFFFGTISFLLFLSFLPAIIISSEHSFNIMYDLITMFQKLRFEFILSHITALFILFIYFYRKKIIFYLENFKFILITRLFIWLIFIYTCIYFNFIINHPFLFSITYIILLIVINNIPFLSLERNKNNYNDISFSLLPSALTYISILIFFLYQDDLKQMSIAFIISGIISVYTRFSIMLTNELNKIYQEIDIKQQNLYSIINYYAIRHTYIISLYENETTIVFDSFYKPIDLSSFEDPKMNDYYLTKSGLKLSIIKSRSKSILDLNEGFKVELQDVREMIIYINKFHFSFYKIFE